MSRRIISGLALAGTVGFSTIVVATAATAQGSDPSASTPVCAAVWVTRADATPQERARARRSPGSLLFSATAILDLELDAFVPAAYAARKMELKLFTPKGHLYQAFDLAVPPMVAGAADPDPSRDNQGTSRYQVRTARLPVAGTTIVNSSLYGVWRAEVYVQGASAPCGRARRFAIEP